MRKISQTFAAVLFLLGSGIHEAGATVFSDGVFNDANWDLAVEIYGLPADGGTGGGTGAQALSGGNPDQYRAVTAFRDPDTAGLNNSTWVYSFYQDMTYDPSALGAIDQMDVGVDAIQFGGGSGGTLKPALRQGGVNYVAVPSQVMGDASWTNHVFLGLTEGDFIDRASLSIMPDFSASGGVIEFGWVYVVSTPFETPVSREVGFDNWIVTITRAPEPATLALLATGLAGLRLARRRRSNV